MYVLPCNVLVFVEVVKAISGAVPFWHFLLNIEQTVTVTIKLNGTFRNTHIIKVSWCPWGLLILLDVSMWVSIGKVFYGIFVCIQLSLALYFSYQAIHSWKEAPIVVSGTRLIKYGPITLICVSFQLKLLTLKILSFLLFLFAIQFHGLGQAFSSYLTILIQMEALWQDSFFQINAL